MKPLRLEFCGINSFSEPAVIDFRALLDYGLFGIFGDTGSGKSTIPDCIGFALYGNVSRSRSGSISDIINYRLDKAYVHLEFEITYDGKRRRYLAERELKRKNAAQTLKVYEYDGDSAVCIADGVREGNALLEKIVGLEQKDFEKCIALPQGEFAQFVKSARSDRLKLVSRLFDLERYGEGLQKRTNAACNEAKSAAEILKVRLERYGGVTEAGIAGLKGEIAELAKKTEALKKTLEAKKEEERRIAQQLSLAKEAKKLNERLLILDREREEIERLEGEISRLFAASVAVKAVREKRESEKEAAEAQTAQIALEERRRLALADFERAKCWNAEKADEEISALTELRVRAESRMAEEKRILGMQEKLVLSRRTFASLMKEFEGFHYSEEKEAIEARLKTLETGDFVTFVSARLKAVLESAEYARFADELGGLQKKHPAVAGDVLPLIEKYRRLSAAESTDLTALKEEYENKTRAYNEEQKKLTLLEKRNGSYQVHREKLQQLETEGRRLKSEIAEAEAALGGELPPLQEIDAALIKKKKEKRVKSEALEQAKSALSGAETLLAAGKARAEAGARRLEKAGAECAEALSSGGFRSEDEARDLVTKYGDAEAAKARVRNYRDERGAIATRLEALKDAPAVTEEDYVAVKENLTRTEAEYSSLTETLVLKRSEFIRAEQSLAEKKELQKEYNAANKKYELTERLKKLLDGNKLMEFVAEEYLVTVAANASRRLLKLTDGRYFLRYEKGFFVGDNFDGGNLRGVYTLSGGETFLVSLSLALALSDEICFRSLRPSDFFFLDEGFGTLDLKLVDTVMDSLEKLRSENFCIGIISHVEELKHRIDRKLTVKKATEKHGSQIQTE